MAPRNCYTTFTTFTTFTTVTVVLGLALPCPALSLRCRYQAELLRAREQPLAILDTATGEVVRMTLNEGNNVRRPDGSPLGLGSGKDQSRRFTSTASIDNVDTSE